MIFYKRKESEMKKMLEIYRNIKKYRKALNLTQTELAKKMGYADKSMIAKIEKGQVDLPQSKILSFAQALNVQPSDLMGWDEYLGEEILGPDTIFLPTEGKNAYNELMKLIIKNEDNTEILEKILSYSNYLINDAHNETKITTQTTEK